MKYSLTTFGQERLFGVALLFWATVSKSDPLPDMKDILLDRIRLASRRMGVLLVVTICWSQTIPAAVFTYAEVCQRARILAAQTFQPATNRLSEALANLTYDELRAIRFRPEKSLWHQDGLPFQIEFFHPGGLSRDIVTIHEVNRDKVSLIPFAPDHFSYPTNHQHLAPPNGFAGFRIVSVRKKRDEIASFLGASYFRMVGWRQTYGTSARGLALNTTKLGAEEFPVFREFWICKPAKRDKDIKAFALMDSPSAAGAFEFVIRPGDTTVATVTANLFPRQAVSEFGIAPLTSMFLHDENSHSPNRDFRPEVHDADGLLMHTGRGEWIWRPLEAGKMARFNVYPDENPAGFGLMQRDRNFDHYDDLVALYHDRPNVWIKPNGNWGNGAIKLVQLASDSEYNDNIVAFWVPAALPKAGESLAVSYEVQWLMNDVGPRLGRALSTRIGEASGGKPPNLRFVIEFVGPTMKSNRAADKLEAVVRCGEGAQLVTHALVRNDFRDTWRLVVEITHPARAVDLSAYLSSGKDQPVTETWNYTWQP